MDPIDSIDFVQIVVSRQDVEAGDITPTLNSLARLLESRESVIRFCERADIAFEGYDTDHRELFEVPEIRRFVQQLDAKFPYWLYFFSTEADGLKCLLLCLLSPYLTPEAKRRHFPAEIDAIMSRSWLPAMGAVCASAGISNAEHNELVDRIHQYITGRPRPSIHNP